MAQTQMNLQLDIKDIYARLCPKCQEEIRKLIKERITDGMVSSVTGETKEGR